MTNKSTLFIMLVSKSFKKKLIHFDGHNHGLEYFQNFTI